MSNRKHTNPETKAEYVRRKSMRSRAYYKAMASMRLRHMHEWEAYYQAIKAVLTRECEEPDTKAVRDRICSKANRQTQTFIIQRHPYEWRVVYEHALHFQELAEGFRQPLPHEVKT